MRASGHCLFVIPSPTDDVIFGCFRSIAQRWQMHVTGERLLLKGDVPITACLTTSEPSSALTTLVSAHSGIVARIELDFGALRLSYVRSGYGPVSYRKNFFDDVRVECKGSTSMHEGDLVQMFRELCTSLQARPGIISPDFARLVEQACAWPTARL